MPVPLFLTDTSAPGIIAPDASVTEPESVAPVTCECTETVRVKLKIAPINDARIFLTFRKPKPSIESSSMIAQYSGSVPVKLYKDTPTATHGPLACNESDGVLKRGADPF